MLERHYNIASDDVHTPDGLHIATRIVHIATRIVHIGTEKLHTGYAQATLNVMKWTLLIDGQHISTGRVQFHIANEKVLPAFAVRTLQCNAKAAVHTAANAHCSWDSAYGS